MPTKTKKSSRGASLIPIQFRFPRGLLLLLNDRLEREREARPGLNITRTDIVRDILYRDLEPRPVTNR